jgi:hypothetical protein
MKRTPFQRAHKPLLALWSIIAFMAAACQSDRVGGTDAKPDARDVAVLDESDIQHDLDAMSDGSQTCQQSGTACQNASECCAGLTCQNNMCRECALGGQSCEKRPCCFGFCSDVSNEPDEICITD